MNKEKSLAYQDGKIKYHEMFVGYYGDMMKNTGIGRIDNDQVDEDIAYHKNLVVYHKKRKAIIARGC